MEILTHARHDIFVVNKGYVKQETSEDEDCCIQVLDFGVVDDGPDNQVNRYDQNNNRNYDWNLGIQWRRFSYVAVGNHFVNFSSGVGVGVGGGSGGYLVGSRSVFFSEAHDDQSQHSSSVENPRREAEEVNQALNIARNDHCQCHDALPNKQINNANEIKEINETTTIRSMTLDGTSNEPSDTDVE